jgi:hypothetical protein
MKIYYYKKTIDVVFTAQEDLTEEALLEDAEVWLGKEIERNGLDFCGSDAALKEVKSLEDVSEEWREADALLWGNHGSDISLREALDMDSDYQLYLRLKKRFDK